MRSFHRKSLRHRPEQRIRPQAPYRITTKRVMLAGTIARLLILWRWRQEKNLNAFYGWFAEDNTVITTGTCLIANCLRNLEAAKKNAGLRSFQRKKIEISLYFTICIMIASNTFALQL